MDTQDLLFSNKRNIKLCPSLNRLSFQFAKTYFIQILFIFFLDKFFSFKCKILNKTSLFPQISFYMYCGFWLHIYWHSNSLFFQPTRKISSPKNWFNCVYSIASKTFLNQHFFSNKKIQPENNYIYNCVNYFYWWYANSLFSFEGQLCTYSWVLSL